MFSDGRDFIQPIDGATLLSQTLAQSAKGGEERSGSQPLIVLYRLKIVVALEQNSYSIYSLSRCKRGTKDTKGTVKLINLKQTDNAMAKNEKDKQKNNSTHDTT